MLLVICNPCTDEKTPESTSKLLSQREATKERARIRVVYGNANYADLVRKNGYFVDKTEYIQKLELIENPIYLRPRRFGKSMFCLLLRYYYDINETEHFDKLFGATWIGQHPTGNQDV